MISSAWWTTFVRRAGLVGMMVAFPGAVLFGATMKAVVVHQYGGPEVLKLEDVPVPDPKDDEVLVKVFAAGVNSFDDVLRTGKYAKAFNMQLPWIPGYDIAGTVEKVGGKVSKFKPGDPVYAFISIPTGGGYAEYALAKEHQVITKAHYPGFRRSGRRPECGSNGMAGGRRQG